MEWTDSDVARFMRQVDQLPGGCWYWMGARSRGRSRRWYGSFRVGRRVVRAHKFAAEAVGGKGPLPRGQHRSHTCCFSMCVAPDHIEYTTPEANQAAKRRGLDTRDLVTGMYNDSFGSGT